MTAKRNGNAVDEPRILMFSERNIHEREVWRCSFHEFEGMLQQIDSVDLLAPTPRKWYRYGMSVACRLGEHLAIPINSGIPKIKLDRDYDLFLAVCQRPSELLHLSPLKGWRSRCKTAFCWLVEFYVKDMSSYKSCLEILSHFDHVLFMFNTSEPFHKILRAQGHYLPAGIDALGFCPYPNPPKRSIDVLSIGRRSEHTHQALLRAARRAEIFYVYDTIDHTRAYDLEEHRLLVANLAKRSRYFIVNPSLVNAPHESGGQIEFGYRYFEAAAPGTLMIGERAKNKEFDRIFHWDDAVIDLPFGSDQIVDVMREFDKQPERQMRMRRTNMIQTLLHHDWVYRWEAVLSMAGLPPLPGLLKRKERLRELSTVVAAAQIEP